MSMNIILFFIYESIAILVAWTGENGVHQTLNGYPNLPDSLMPVYNHYDYLRHLGIDKLSLIFLLHLVIILFLNLSRKEKNANTPNSYRLSIFLIFILGIIGWMYLHYAIVPL